MNYQKVKMCRMCGKQRACCGFGPEYCWDCANARLTLRPESIGDCSTLFSGNGHSSGGLQGSWDNLVQALEESR